MYLTKYLFVASLIFLSFPLFAKVLKKDVYMEFKIPPIIQYDAIESKRPLKELKDGTIEHSNLIKGSISANTPWQITAKLEQELPEDMYIKLKSVDDDSWKSLNKYTELSLAKGSKAIQDKEITVNALSKNLQTNGKEPVIIILTVSTQTPKEVIKAKRMKVNETD